VPYVIFEVKSAEAGKINTIIKDDLVSRQSIVIRDASALDIKKDVSYLKIEGSKEGLSRAEEIAKELGVSKLPEKKAKTIDDKIQEQEDSAATGMGMIFD
jgi:hypothetical protein